MRSRNNKTELPLVNENGETTSNENHSHSEEKEPSRFKKWWKGKQKTYDFLQGSEESGMSHIPSRLIKMYIYWQHKKKAILAYTLSTIILLFIFSFYVYTHIQETELLLYGKIPSKKSNIIYDKNGKLMKNVFHLDKSKIYIPTKNQEFDEWIKLVSKSSTFIENEFESGFFETEVFKESMHNHPEIKHKKIKNQIYNVSLESLLNTSRMSDHIMKKCFSAIQYGIPRNILFLNTDSNLVLIDPEITYKSTSEKQIRFTFDSNSEKNKNIYYTIMVPEKISIRYKTLTSNGKKTTRDFENYEAAVLYHNYLLFADTKKYYELNVS